MLIKYCKITCKNLDEALLFSRKNRERTGILSENVKTLTSSNYPVVQYFLLNFAHFSYLAMSAKMYVGFFKFCSDLELFAKIKRDLVSTHSLFTLLLIAQDLNKITKSRTPFCRHYLVENVCKTSAKISNSIVVGARQSFQFFRHKTWFLANSRSLP